LTVQGTPGQTGLTAAVFFNGSYYVDPQGFYYQPLTETAPGTYELVWSGTGKFCYYSCTPIGIAPDGTYTFQVYDAAYTELGTALLPVTGVSGLSVSADPFSPVSGETLTVTATGAAGLALEVEIIRQSTGAEVRQLSLAANGAAYVGVWDGL